MTLGAAGCTEEQKPNLCSGVTCSGHGECTDMDGKPFCQCDSPYKTSASGKECELACEDVACSAHGTCTEPEGQPQCVCAAGYVPTTDGKSCVKDGDPCAGIDCCDAGICKLDGQGQPYCECTGGTAPNDKNPLCCTTPCEVVDICTRPTAAMCKQDNDCCGFGVCKIDEDGDAYCECEYAYQMDQFDRTCCLRTGEPLESGQICSNGTDCKTNFCMMYGGEDTGYCSRRGCNTNSECKNHSGDGKAMCCEDFGGENYVCFKLGSGCNCGDSSGGCGASCACQSETACGQNFICLASSAAGLDDPNAYCSKQCNTEDDCNECDDPDDPKTTFRCEAIGGGQKYCQPQRDDGCTRSGDCRGTEVCAPFPNDDMTGLIGLCATLGDLPTGSACDTSSDPNNLPASERCAGFYCMSGHCSEICEFDSDCPEGMRCATMSFRMDDAGNVVAEVGMCLGFEGSLQDCGGYPDCPDGEFCGYYVNSNDELKKLCTTENCDLEAPDCSPPGTKGCGDDGAAPCWGDMCLLASDGTSFCSIACESSEHCPEGTVCICCLGLTDTHSIPICFPFEGSANPCTADHECPDGEICTYNQGVGGIESICKVRNDPGSPCGAECGQGLPPCYNDLCLTDGVDSWCSAVCEESADCPDGFMCGGLSFQGDPNIYGACSPAAGSGDPCGRDTDCPAGEACTYNQTPLGAIEAVCLQAHDPSGQLGDVCGEGQPRCYNDLCLSSGGGPSFCSAVCTHHADCPNGWLCGGLQFSGSDDVVGACIQADGTGANCQTDAGCTTAGEYCHLAAPPPNQPMEPICLTGTGGAPTDACDGQNPCRNDLCVDGACSAVCDTNAYCSQFAMDCVWLAVVTAYGPACKQPDATSPLCSLCAVDADCGGDSKCIESTAKPGEKYCGLPCPTGDECGSLAHPMGPFTCTDVGGAVNNCKPDGDTCNPSP
jgi:hypothetical protein